VIVEKNLWKEASRVLVQRANEDAWFGLRGIYEWNWFRKTILRL